MLNKCNICSSEKLNTQDTVSSSHYIKLYKEILNLDVSMYFKDTPAVDIEKCLNCGFVFFAPKSLQASPEFYERLAVSDSYFNQDKWEFTEALSGLETGMKVLEVGCGNGKFIQLAKEKGIEVTGLDTAPVNLEFTTVINSTIEDYSKDHKEEYDVVVAFQVLEHLTEIKTFVESCLAVLKPKGQLIYAVPNNEAKVLKLDPKNCLNMPPHHMALFTKESLSNMSDYYNMKTLDWKAEPLSEQHYKRYYRINIVHLRNRFGFLGKILDKLLYPFSERLVRTFRRHLFGQAMIVKYVKT